MKIVNNGWVTENNSKRRVNTMEKYKYLIGQKINKWTVLSLDNSRRHLDAICECECGTIKPIVVNNLINGLSRDCGCGRKRKLSEVKSKDFIGMKFGKLTVIEALPETNKFNRKVYKCKCDCGNEIYVPSSSLSTNHTLSCGCLLSFYNIYITNVLKDIGVEFYTEYVVDINDGKYRFDFYIPSYNLFIEYDGSQHFVPRFYVGIYGDDGMSMFEKAQHRDEIKNEYCVKNNINLLRIPYWESNNIKTIIIDCLQRLNERGSGDKPEYVIV